MGPSREAVFLGEKSDCAIYVAGPVEREIAYDGWAGKEKGSRYSESAICNLY